MADVKTSLENQIKVLEQIQEKAISEGNMDKALEISHSIISISNTINSLQS